MSHMTGAYRCVRLARPAIAFFFVLLLFGVGVAPSIALEWTAQRLRGPVHIVIDGEWVPIGRGDVVHSGTIVRTGPSGVVEFRNGPNMVALASDTQVKFIDWSEHGQTWVQQWFGEVEVDVEVQNVNHFAVQTPMMVAVVKGTRFTVSSSDHESSVNVIRGSVAVQDTVRSHFVSLGAGQSVSGGAASEMHVAGDGALPVIVTAHGRPVAPADQERQPTTGNGAAGNSGNTPAATGHRPGNSGNTPAATGHRPGNSGNTPAATGHRPGNSGNTPAATGHRPGNSGNTPAAASGNGPARSGNTSDGSGGPGNSDNTPAASGHTPGNSGNTPAGGNGGGPGNGNGNGNGNGKGRR